MREIVFRGKKIRAGKWSKWIYGSLDYTKYTYNEARIVAEDDPIQYWNKVDKNTIGQYTGIKDKNEIRIFEGDIISIKIKNQIIKALIVYSDKYTSFILKYTNTLQCECDNLGNYESKDIEVIGNIYDNKEMLEELE